MPQAHPPTEDLAALTALARAAGRRIGSLAALPALTPEPSVPAATSRSDGTMQKGGWIPGGNRPPQKGPKPFEGWER